MSDQLIPSDYASWLADLKSRIQRSRATSALAVNQELVRLYHHIGGEILARQSRQGWGAKVIDRLAADLMNAFPDMKGLSSRNLKYMKVFAELCPTLQIGQQAAAQLPWFHIVTLLSQVKDPDQREWYAIRAVERAWSRPTLQANIKSQLHLREGAALTNFKQRLPETQIPVPHKSVLLAHDRHAERARGSGKSSVVRCHRKVDRGSFAPELCGGEVNGVERPQCGRQRLCGPIEDHACDIYDRQCGEESEDGFTPARQGLVRDALGDAQTIQGAQAFHLG